MGSRWTGWRSLAGLALVGGVLWTGAANACGPGFPTNLLLTEGDPLTSGPYGDLEKELARFEIPGPAGMAYSNKDQATVERDQLVTRFGETAATTNTILAFRTELQAWKDADPSRIRYYWEPEPKPRGPAPEVPSVEMPEEWRLYLRGARAWAIGDRAAASQFFREVLELPAPQRTDKELWARYMLGRLDPLGPDFGTLRAAVAAGTPDPHGLAVASLGEEAAARLWTEPVQALTLYLQQMALGDPGAGRSVKFATQDLLENPEMRAILATDPLGQRVVAAVLAADGESRVVSAWLDALPTQGGDAAGADRLAWLAWRAGRWDLAVSLAERAPDEPLSRWVRGRALLRAGKPAEAGKLLGTVGFDPTTEWNCSWDSREEWYSDGSALRPAEEVAAEQGLAYVHGGDYPSALAAMGRADHWPDLAYVAERLVQVEELGTYLGSPLANELSEVERTNLTALYARRLAREGRWEEALAHYPPESRAHAERFLAERKRGGPDGLYQAARILREHGMELQGTELGPDWAIYGGEFSLGFARPTEGPTYLTPTSAEKVRMEQTLAKPNRRFHYRYVAADMAWEAAELLPEKSEQASKVLCTAGLWIEYWDPEAADRYYKATVTRSWGSPVSETADAIRWFPSAGTCHIEKVDETPRGACAQGSGPTNALFGSFLGLMLAAGRRWRARELG
jgi:hypothetical protein